MEKISKKETKGCNVKVKYDLYVQLNAYSDREDCIVEDCIILLGDGIYLIDAIFSCEVVMSEDIYKSHVKSRQLENIISSMSNEGLIEAFLDYNPQYKNIEILDTSLESDSISVEFVDAELHKVNVESVDLLNVELAD